MIEVQGFDTVEALQTAAVAQIVLAAERALEARGRFRLVLAGGSTPRGVYQRLARAPEEMRWDLTDCFWGDERCVAPEHADSNYRMAVETLLQHVPIPPDNVHRMRGEAGAERGADEYHARLARLFGSTRPEALTEPAFDLVLLGLGDDGHTASLFPGTAALDAAGWAAAGEAPAHAPTPARITLTLPALAAARECLFLVTGPAKRSALDAVLAASAELPLDTPLLPAARVRPHGAVRWLTADV